MTSLTTKSLTGADCRNTCPPFQAGSRMAEAHGYTWRPVCDGIPDTFLIE